MKKKSTRKVHKGDVYNKERTKEKLINAVGHILVKEGFQNIKISKVETVAGVSKKLVYRYFGGLNGLIKAYLHRVDFWKIEEQKIDAGGTMPLPDISREFMFNLLKADFEYFFKSAEMQKIVLWGISQKNKLIRTLVDEREELGDRVFEKSDEIFEKTEVDYRATIAIFVSAIYYMVLHAKTNGSTICGVDVATTEGKERIFTALERLLEQTYKYSKVKLK